MKFPIVKGVNVPGDILREWQETLNLLADIAEIPTALIVRVYEKDVEILVRSASADNPYHAGDRAALDTGLYCEAVMEKRETLFVPDAKADPAWKNAPDANRGMVSYFGVPLEWPTGHMFGTICILDRKAHTYSDKVQRLVERFRRGVELDLRLLHSNAVLHDSLEFMSRSVGALAAAERRESMSGVAREVVHELNNLLMPIINLTSLARDQLPDGSRYRRNLDQVLKAADQARESVSKLRRIAVSRETPTIPLDFASVVRATLTGLEHMLPAGVSLQAAIPEHAGMVLAHRQELEWVLTDLIDRSVEFLGTAGGATGGTIAVTLGPDNTAPNTACLTISSVMDGRTGEKGAAAPAVKFGALASLQAVLGAYGGTLHVDETPGRRTRFDVILPIC